MTDMFHWDEVLEAWTLDPKYISQYLDAQRQALKDAGFSDNYINQYINA
jgi:predicted outer membrane protein